MQKGKGLHAVMWVRKECKPQFGVQFRHRSKAACQAEAERLNKKYPIFKHFVVRDIWEEK